MFTKPWKSWQWSFEKESWGRAGLTAAALLMWVSPVLATTYTITELGDGVAADGSCRLREALQAARNLAAVNECPAGTGTDTLVLQAVGVYSFALGQESLSSGNLTVEGATGDPAAHVVDLGGANRFVFANGNGVLTLRGLTLTRGNALGEAPPEGGAIFIEQAALTLADVVISSSSAARGGGLKVGGSGTSRLERVRFENNLAMGIPSLSFGVGGGAYFITTDATINLSDVVFDGNRADTEQPGSSSIGGGLALTAFGATDLLVERSVFRNQQVDGMDWGDGAGIQISAQDTSRIVISDSLFEGNESLAGGSISVGSALSVVLFDNTSMELRRLRVAGNLSPTASSAQVLLNLSSAATALVESTLIRNGNQAGIFAFKTGTGTLLAGQLTVTGHASSGMVTATSGAATVRLENSILWGNGAPDLDVVTGLADVDRMTNHNWIGSLGDPDPLFVAPGLGDYSLASGSGALDQGDASFASVGPLDLAHAPRVSGLGLDLGALERGGLFADGFESGDTGVWTQTVP